MSSVRSRRPHGGRDARRERLLGRETPRIFTPPLRELTPETSLGFSVIAFAEVVGIDLMPWQKWLLIHAMELLEDGTFRFRTVVVLVARQNGKSTLSQVLALWALYVFGLRTVIGTAQDLDVAEEIWQGAVDIAEESPELAAEIARVIRVNGKKAMVLTSGARYKVKAANRRAGRGLSGELILLDELREHQSWLAWGAITKTTMAKLLAMIWALSNAGDATSVVLRHLRAMAHDALGDPDGVVAGTDPGPPPAETLDDLGDDVVEVDDQDPSTLGLFEWSAPPGCDKWDRDAWAQANPAMGHTLPERNIADACRTDPEWVFRNEVLCQWSDMAADGPFPPGTWEAGTDPTSVIADDSPVVFALDVSVDRTHTHIAAAGYRPDGVPHVEVVASRAGTEWPTGWFASRASAEHPMTVAVQARGAPASSLLDELRAVEHLTVVEVGGPDLGNATAQFYDLVGASGLREHDDGPPARAGVTHLPQPVLDVAAATAVPRILDGGGMAWDRRKSPHDIAPLVAATFAVWLLTQPAPQPPARSAYEDSDLLILD